MTIQEINDLGINFGFTVTDNFDFVIVNNRQGRIITQQQLNVKFNNVNDVWDFICNNGLKNIHSILSEIK